jgi:hypothetical protein
MIADRHSSVDAAITELDQLIGRLAALGGEFATAWQPEAAERDTSLQDEVTALVTDHPFLARDPGYVAFLRRYAGALLVRDGGFLLSLFGFSHDIGMHLVEGPGELIENGHMIFGDMTVPRTQEYPYDSVAVGFGFDATGKQRWGVYRFIAGGPGTWYCETFLQCLRSIADKATRPTELLAP